MTMFAVTVSARRPSSTDIRLARLGGARGQSACHEAASTIVGPSAARCGRSCLLPSCGANPASWAIPGPRVDVGTLGGAASSTSELALEIVRVTAAALAPSVPCCSAPQTRQQSHEESLATGPRRRPAAHDHRQIRTLPGWLTRSLTGVLQSRSL